MRDLYQRLALQPDATPQSLQRTIEACQHSALKQDAEAVFALPERRDAYDELHATLSDIGRLRSRLGLSHGAHWQGSVANDFSRPPDHAISRHDELIDRVSHAVTLYNRWRCFRGVWLLVATFGIGTGAGLAAGVVLCTRLW